jgi:hypothetical protein
MGKMEYLDQSLDVVKNFKPLTHEQISVLGAKARQAAMTGKYELFRQLLISTRLPRIPRGWVEVRPGSRASGCVLSAKGRGPASAIHTSAKSGEAILLQHLAPSCSRMKFGRQML